MFGIVVAVVVVVAVIVVAVIVVAVSLLLLLLIMLLGLSLLMILLVLVLLSLMSFLFLLSLLLMQLLLVLLCCRCGCCCCCRCNYCCWEFASCLRLLSLFLLILRFWFSGPVVAVVDTKAFYTSYPCGCACWGMHFLRFWFKKGCRKAVPEVDIIVVPAWLYKLSGRCCSN